MINLGGGGEKYLIWLDDVTVSQKGDARRKEHGKLKASAHSGSGNFAQVAKFLEDVENSSFIEDFYPPAPPSGTQSSRDEALIPSEFWNFQLEVDLKAPKERGQGLEEQG